MRERLRGTKWRMEKGFWGFRVQQAWFRALGYLEGQGERCLGGVCCSCLLGAVIEGILRLAFTVQYNAFRVQNLIMIQMQFSNGRFFIEQSNMTLGALLVVFRQRKHLGLFSIDLGLGVKCLFMFRVQGLGFRVQGLRFQEVRFRVLGLGFGVWVQALVLRVSVTVRVGSCMKVRFYDFDGLMFLDFIVLRLKDQNFVAPSVQIWRFISDLAFRFQHSGFSIWSLEFSVAG